MNLREQPALLKTRLGARTDHQAASVRIKQQQRSNRPALRMLGLVFFAGLAAGLLAGVSTQFIQCGEYRSAVKVSTCNTRPPPLKRQDPQGLPLLRCDSRAAVGDGPYARILVLHIWPGVLGSQHLQHGAAQRPNVRLAACGTKRQMNGRQARWICLSQGVTQHDMTCHVWTGQPRSVRMLPTPTSTEGTMKECQQGGHLAAYMPTTHDMPGCCTRACHTGTP